MWDGLFVDILAGQEVEDRSQVRVVIERPVVAPATPLQLAQSVIETCVPVSMYFLLRNCSFTYLIPVQESSWLHCR